ncbi:MAG: ribonuclease H-like domain-containing protein [Chitinophagaceae bacterium]|nr:ribonuclease H-like domain-containing protein [Rubrivivax sp.]
MSLADLAASKPTTVPGLIGQNILIADIERIKGQALVPLEFFDLSEIKYKQRIHADHVTVWPRTICMAAKWYGEGEPVRFLAEWQKGGYERFMRRTWKMFDKAQIVVGHNMAGFDVKRLNGGWNELGFPPPSPFKVVDTLKVAWSQFGYESNTLDSLCKRFGITAKSGHYDAKVAQAAADGDKAAQENIQSYNEGDILASEALYDYLRPWIKTHPHNANGTADDRPVCNRCWQPEMVRQGYVLAQVISYTAYRCSVCGGNLKTVAHHRAARISGV